MAPDDPTMDPREEALLACLVHDAQRAARQVFAQLEPLVARAVQAQHEAPSGPDDPTFEALVAALLQAAAPDVAPTRRYGDFVPRPQMS